MKALVFYSVCFGIPILLYLIWLFRFQKQCPFLGLLIIAVVLVWIILWPTHYSPSHQRALDEPGDGADMVINGFIVLGWINGLIGSLPVILFEIPRSILILMRKKRT